MSSAEDAYPSFADILAALGDECVLVGSVVTKGVAQAKDIDVVVSAAALAQLKAPYGDYIVEISPEYAMYIFMDVDKALDIFCGLADIEDVSKHSSRVTYEEASAGPLSTREIFGHTMKAFDPELRADAIADLPLSL